MVKRAQSIEYYVHGFIVWLEICIKKSKERLITVANNSIGNINTDWKTIKKWKSVEKQLYGYFNDKRLRLYTRRSGSGYGIKNIKRETDSLLIVTQPMPPEPIIGKQKSIIRHTIAWVSYVLTEMKR